MISLSNRVASFTLLTLMAASPAFAQTSSDLRIQDLEKKLQDLDEKYRTLERRLEREGIDASTGKSNSIPLVSIGEDGFKLGTADGNFKLQLKGVLQVDSRNFIHNVGGAPVDTFLIRRARPILEGTVYKNIDFQFVPDFGGNKPTVSPTIYDANVNYRLLPELQFKIGKFKAPVGLERLQTDAYVEFNERGLTSNLEPDREIGLQAHGTISGGVLTYAAGVFNGVGDAQGSTLNTDGDNYKSFAGRIFAHPFRNTSIEPLRGLGVGVAGTFGEEQSLTSDVTSGYVTDGQQTFFNYTGVTTLGDHWHFVPQAYYYYGPFWLLGEYAISDQHLGSAAKSIDAQNRAWELEGGWVITGEDASYTGVRPSHAFDPLNGGGWGAFELVGRYSELTVDGNVFPTFAANGSAHGADAFTVGLNWYWNTMFRLSLSYAHTTFSGVYNSGAAGALAVTKGNESVIFTRAQLNF